MALPVFSVHVATDTHVGSVVADGQSSIFTSVYYCNQEVIQQHKHIFAIAALRTSVPVHTPYPSRTRSHTRTAYARRRRFALWQTCRPASTQASIYVDH